MPHRPNTTDGMAASRSITVTTDPRSRRGASSVRNSAMPIEIGTAMSSAISEDHGRAVDEGERAELRRRSVAVRVVRDPRSLLVMKPRPMS